MYKLRKQPDIAEVHQYVEDLKAIIDLRVLTHRGSEEYARYTNIIKVMQLVLVELNRK